MKKNVIVLARNTNIKAEVKTKTDSTIPEPITAPKASTIEEKNNGITLSSRRSIRYDEMIPLLFRT